jgi:hypothetical protein
MNDVGLNVACPQPARQPEDVPASLECHRDAFDRVPSFRRPLTEAAYQSLAQGETRERDLGLDDIVPPHDPRACVLYISDICTAPDAPPSACSETSGEPSPICCGPSPTSRAWPPGPSAPKAPALPGSSACSPFHTPGFGSH